MSDMATRFVELGIDAMVGTPKVTVNVDDIRAITPTVDGVACVVVEIRGRSPLVVCEGYEALLSRLDVVGCDVMRLTRTDNVGVGPKVRK